MNGTRSPPAVCVEPTTCPRLLIFVGNVSYPPGSVPRSVTAKRGRGAAFACEETIAATVNAAIIVPEDARGGITREAFIPMAMLNGALSSRKEKEPALAQRSRARPRFSLRLGPPLRPSLFAAHRTSRDTRASLRKFLDWTETPRWHEARDVTAAEWARGFPEQG